MPAASVSVDNGLVSVDDRSGLRPGRIAPRGGDSAAQADGAMRMVPRTGTVQPVIDSAPARPADFAPVEGFLHLLARAIRQIHTYPPTSPLCTDAITACHKALASIEYRDRLTLRVTPSDLIVDEVHVGAGTIVEDEIVRRLSKVRVATLDIDRIASPRDLSRFCVDLVQSEDLDRTKMTFAELLAEHGVHTLVPNMARRPEVLDVGAPSAPARHLLEHERRRRQSRQPDAPVSYLYPPDKGWVRVDPAETLEAVSLMDLVVLVDDPAEVATMLLRLTDEDPVGPDARHAALERKFTDVTTLFSALDPQLARVMFAKLARAVLELAPERRKSLLQGTILPGLLDGRADGNVLRDFPDVDLAESLCLLLELETAAPEVLTAAINRLGLTPDRREAVVPLIDARLRAQQSGDSPAGPGRESGIDRYARGLIKVEAKSGKDFSEFAAFDLSIDDHAAAAVALVRDGIGRTDVPATQLRCLWQLVRLEPNPTVVDAFLGRVQDLFGELERAGRWKDLAASVTGYRRLADELKERRPDVAETISKALADFSAPARILALIELNERDAEGRGIASDLIKALGVALVPGFVALLDDAAHQGKARALVSLMCEHAASLAAALEAELGRCSVGLSRVIVKVLGYGGAGYESAVAGLAGHGDGQVAREALRALARIGTDAAAALIARQIREGSAERRVAAEEALWHFPAAQSAVQARQLLRSRDFVHKHPQTVARLLDRVAQTGPRDIDDVLAALEPLRFRFWKPGLVRIGFKARELRGR
jgi:hypothetical protein